MQSGQWRTRTDYFPCGNGRQNGLKKEASAGNLTRAEASFLEEIGAADIAFILKVPLPGPETCAILAENCAILAELSGVKRGTFSGRRVKDVAKHDNFQAVRSVGMKGKWAKSVRLSFFFGCFDRFFIAAARKFVYQVDSFDGHSDICSNKDGQDFQISCRCC